MTILTMTPATDDDISEREMWRAYDRDQRDQRAVLRQAAPGILRAAGLKFTATIDTHIQVHVRTGLVIDFWPGTGLWRRRGTPGRRYGIDALIQWCKEQQT